MAAELGARIGALQETAFLHRRRLRQAPRPGPRLETLHGRQPATGSATTYKLADFVTVWKALPSGYRASSSWLINADDFGSLAGLADTAGGLVLPGLQFDPPSLFGRPVFIADLPAPAASAKSLVLGDFKRSYGIRRVNGVTFHRQDEIHSDVGQIGLRSYARVDGRPLLADAARILAHSAT